MCKIKYDMFIQADVDKIVQEAHFTDEQLKVFLELCRGTHNDVGIYTLLCISQTKYYILKKKVQDKVLRVLA